MPPPSERTMRFWNLRRDHWQGRNRCRRQKARRGLAEKVKGQAELGNNIAWSILTDEEIKDRDIPLALQISKQAVEDSRPRPFRLRKERRGRQGAGEGPIGRERRGKRSLGKDNQSLPRQENFLRNNGAFDSARFAVTSQARRVSLSDYSFPASTCSSIQRTRPSTHFLSQSTSSR